MTGAAFLPRLAGLDPAQDLVVLAGGDSAFSIIQFGVPAVELHDIEDLSIPDGSMQDAAHGWPLPDAGCLLQLDYEWPVGSWAHATARTQRARGRLWPLQHGLCLDPAGNGVRPQDGRHPLWRRDPGRLPEITAVGPAQPAWSRAVHVDKVETARSHIAAGTIYQLNLTMPIHVTLEPQPDLDLALFAALLAEAPGGYAALIRSGGHSIISHSPECCVQMQDGRCRSLPIKGTRARVSGEEGAARAELLAAAKDNAELAMIVDLVRNDLGRVAQVGGVQVTHAAEVVDLSYVHHLHARIDAVLAADRDVRDLLRAVYPAGSITGAPKIKAMQLIRALEAGDRGPYCGSIGWAGGRSCALSVAIRTMDLQADGRVRLQAGGGIVADSDGAAEWDELMAKAAPMLRACGLGHTSVLGQSC